MAMRGKAAQISSVYDASSIVAVEYAPRCYLPLRQAETPSVSVTINVVWNSSCVVLYRRLPSGDGRRAFGGGHSYHPRIRVLG
jgi:hypothetical protein